MMASDKIGEDPNMTATDDRTALLIIDVQQGLDEPRLGRRNNPAAERNMARLLAYWRARSRPIFHVRHMSTERDSPLRPELPGNAIKREVAPIGPEPVIEKQVNSAFIGADLQERLEAAGSETLVIIGLTTNHCVSSTARMAGDLGFRAIVVPTPPPRTKSTATMAGVIRRRRCMNWRWPTCTANSLPS